MNLVYVYGPPAVGKLTVATELASRTGYKIFHNHLTIAATQAVFDSGTEPFYRALHGIRERILAEAALGGIDLVMTGVYSHPESAGPAQRRLAAVEKNGGRVCLVHLVCSEQELEQRVTAEHRRTMGKIAEVELLRENVATRDFFTPIPNRNSLRIDNTDLPAPAAATQIIDHFGLPAR
jgi:hypothetical protein